MYILEEETATFPIFRQTYYEICKVVGKRKFLYSSKLTFVVLGTYKTVI